MQMTDFCSQVGMTGSFSQISSIHSISDSSHVRFYTFQLSRFSPDRAPTGNEANFHAEQLYEVDSRFYSPHLKFRAALFSCEHVAKNYDCLLPHTPKRNK
ncbi:hypothetical protein CEXT_600381 [Caerostris extrusa]|uniref:Uncharacterized protein n=1 Tax=Caerostris extrusa TaxID=172846 RepID=A0AAV4QGG0_CAEEX|nr:hypothetical protein CEXT_600381 [Caerostris extrusa]